MSSMMVAKKDGTFKAPSTGDLSWLRPAAPLATRRRSLNPTNSIEADRAKTIANSKLLPTTTAVATTRTSDVAGVAAESPWTDSIAASRLAWVQRKCDRDKDNNDRAGKQFVYWPVLYYDGWEELNTFGMYNMTGQEQCEFAMVIFEHHLTKKGTSTKKIASKNDDDDDENETKIALARLLGVESLQLLELQSDAPDFFLGDFVCSLPQILSEYQAQGPKLFDQLGHLDWYLPWMKALDDAHAILQRGIKGSTHRRQQQQPTGGSKMSLLQMGAERLATYQEETSTRFTTPLNAGHDSEQSPRSSSQADSESMVETPTHSNKSPGPNVIPTAAGQTQEQERDDVTAATVTEESQVGQKKTISRGLFAEDNEGNPADEPPPSAISNNENVKATTKISAAAAVANALDVAGGATPPKKGKIFVTPSRSSTRPRRRAARKPEDQSPMGVQDGGTKRRADTEEDAFYFFPNLIQFLTHELGWNYAKSSKLNPWVYERAGTKGEKGGTFLDDYFYEESQVEEYCRQHNYKEMYQHLLTLATSPITSPASSGNDSDDSGKDTESPSFATTHHGQGVITPVHKRARVQAPCAV